ncbi:hypothetical protein HY025_04205 [Candidatus Daviesbacteria bacterium]|nr:hypothetical protein [Candidatus Daviesbacteria bacterium]
MPQKIRKDVIKEIRFLRSQGHSVPEISNQVAVSKTSVLRYVQGVEILPDYLAQWAGKRGGSRKKRLLKESQAFEEGKKLVNNLSKKEKLLILSALYWAEGNKRDFSLSNTDPNLISVFIQSLREVFNLEDNKFFVNIRIYEDLDKEKCLDFWSKVVRIPKENIKGFNVLQGKKKGKLEYGMCRVRISKGGDILKKIKGINKAVFENLN